MGSLDNSAGPNIAPGTVLFGEYEVIGPLGEGGMGTVYQAKHRSLGGLRAIKVIPVNSGLDKTAEEMFVREARTLIDIRHDAIAHCHDLLRTPDALFLIMELVEGPSLKRLLLRGPLPDDEWMILRNRLLEGLAAVHARNVVHRDISPANIVLPGGQPERAKLIDFGVSAQSDGKQAQAFYGNLSYASPEQFGLFGGRVDARSDLYSLGLVLAEATIGEALHMGGTYLEAKELRKTKPDIPEYINQRAQNDLQAMLEPQPSKRPESAQAILNGLPLKASKSGKQKKNSGAEENGKLIPIIFTASAAGVGFGIGITLWLWKFTILLASVVGPAPAVIAPPQIIGSPGPAPTKPTAPVLPVIDHPAAPPAPNLAGKVSRAQVMTTAQELAEHSWICEEKNRTASCLRRTSYRSDWRPKELVKGEPYSWGQIDNTDQFDAKLRKGDAAGSHSRDGIASCTAGIDCSGYVSYCWGHRGGHAYSTATMKLIADDLHVDPYSDLKPGDALNRPGKHVILFAGYRKNGMPLVYEASGRAARVIRNEDISWAQLKHYRPIRFRNLIDP